MEIKKTKLKNVLLIKPDVFEDHRGEFVKIYDAEYYTEKFNESVDERIRFVEDNISVSAKNVLRGIHGDSKTWKLVSCLYGKFYVVVVNCADDFGEWQSFILSDKNRHQILVPPKHGLAHLVLSDIAVFHYKQSEYYVSAEKQFTYRYDYFNIWWPIKNPILSRRDDEI